MLKISVVTPSYNQVRFVEKCLLSVKRQNHPAVEHIVVDGVSNDGTVEILQQYSSQPGWEHLRWISEPDSGQSDALNKGFRMAKGDMIGWLNSDDFYVPTCFDVLLRAYQQHPNADLLYGDFLWTDEDGVPFQVRREIAFSRFALLHGHLCYVPSSGALFFTRRIIQEGNALNNAYHYAMDYEFFLRLAGIGYRFHHIPALLGGSDCTKSLNRAPTPARWLPSMRRRNENILQEPASSERMGPANLNSPSCAASRTDAAGVRKRFGDIISLNFVPSGCEAFTAISMEVDLTAMGTTPDNLPKSEVFPAMEGHWCNYRD